MGYNRWGGGWGYATTEVSINFGRGYSLYIWGAGG